MAEIDSMLLETGIFASQAVWLWRVRHIRREAKKAGKTYDEYVAENPSEKPLRSKSSGTVVDVEACHGSSRKASILEKVRETSMKSAITTDSANIQEKASASENSLLQRWRRLVLRPVPEVQPWLNTPWRSPLTLSRLARQYIFSPSCRMLILHSRSKIFFGWSEYLFSKPFRRYQMLSVFVKFHQPHESWVEFPATLIRLNPP